MVTQATDLSFLQTEFLRDAKVIDHTKGYISVSSFNLRMKPTILAAAARVISEYFGEDDVNVIHGIPHSGNYLAAAVSLEMAKSEKNKDLRMHASRKDFSVPTSWKDIYRREVQSFTTSSGGMDVYSGITLSFARKGDKVLLLDDVCASGETGYKIIQGLQEKGVKVVGYAVLFDKMFQGGLERVASLGIKVFSCVRVAEVKNNDQIILRKTP
jgi:adenine/guanine phosphoribosyltransferase-like PRPP-binding protein